MDVEVKVNGRSISVSDETKTEVAKPGYKSTEFWLSMLAMVLGFALASGAVADESLAAQIVGGALTILAGLGYTSSRTRVKVAEQEKLKEESKGASFVAYAKEKVEEAKAAKAAKAEEKPAG